MESGETFDGEGWLLRPPAGTRVVESAVSRWWLEDGVVCSQQSGREPITADVIRAGFRTALSLTGGRCAPLLAEGRNSSASTREARDLMSSEEAAAVYCAMGVLVGSPVARTLMNFFMRFSSPPYPVRCFSSPEEARAWARAHVPSPV